MISKSFKYQEPVEQLNALIGCEESQEVAKAFDERNHIVFSCDLEPCSGGRPDLHKQDDIFHCLAKYYTGLDLFIGFPPCTYLCNSGVCNLTRTTKIPGFNWSDHYQIYINDERWHKMVMAAHFFKSLYWTNAKGVGIENPIMHKYAMEIIGIKPTQIIHPWQFGHKEMKATCLWLRGLPPLKPTNIVGPPPKDKQERNKWQIKHRLPPGPNRAKLRSKTFPGIAKAMAEQWG